MMIKPGISTLSTCVDSRYTLVTMAAKRARMIVDEAEKDHYIIVEKPVSIAVKELQNDAWGVCEKN